MSVANPLNPPDAVKQGCWKRKGSEEDGDDSNSSVKKAKYPFYVILESESPQPTSSDEDESIYSIQEQETEFVQDTSDTSTNTWVTSGEDVMHVEYEPAPLSANENPFIDCLTSSDPEISQHIVGYVGAIAATIYDTDVGLADDSDDSLTSRDSEISHADYWTCVQCNNSNNNPLFRYCEKCYQERKLFLPPRPRGKRRRKPSKKRSMRVRALESQELLISHDSGLGSSLVSQTTISSDLKSSQSEKSLISGFSGKSTSITTSLSQDSVDTGFSSSFSQQTSNFLSQPCSSLSSQEENLTIKAKNDESTEKIIDEIEPRYGSQDSQNSLATTLSVSEKNYDISDSSDGEIDISKKIRLSSRKAKLQNKNDNKYCLTCTVGPKNGIFVHGRTAHVCCCYRCSMKVWKTTKHCPYCNRKVTDVLRAYYA